MRRALAIGGISTALLCGCASGGPSYLPLTEGREWSYSVNSGFQNDVITLKVGAKVNVGDYNGVSLAGPVGESRVAWAGSQLIASQFANARFNPPIPILDEAKIPPKKSSGEDDYLEVAKWKGKIESFGKQRAATATLRQRRANIKMLTGKVRAVETVLEIDLGKGKIEVITWFERGTGIIQQLQRTERSQVVRLELLRTD